MRAALADLSGGSGSGDEADNDRDQQPPPHHGHGHGHGHGFAEEDEEAAAAAVMDGDLPVLALRVLLRAATDGHLVALVRYVCVVLSTIVLVFS